MCLLGPRDGDIFSLGDALILWVVFWQYFGTNTKNIVFRRLLFPNTDFIGPLLEKSRNVCMPRCWWCRLPESLFRPKIRYQRRSGYGQRSLLLGSLLVLQARQVRRRVSANHKRRRSQLQLSTCHFWDVCNVILTPVWGFRCKWIRLKIKYGVYDTVVCLDHSIGG